MPYAISHEQITLSLIINIPLNKKNPDSHRDFILQLKLLLFSNNFVW